MDVSIWIAVAAVAAVVVIGLLLRGATGTDAATRPRPDVPVGDAAPPEDTGDAFADALDDFVDTDVEAVAVTSDGYAFVPDLHAVRILPPSEGEDEPWRGESGRRAKLERGAAGLGMSLHAADFTGARVVQQVAADEPWRLEALGRDGEYQSWPFETEDGARAALAVLESRGIVQVGRDEDDRPMPPSAEAFAEARRRHDDTLRELGLDDSGGAED